MRDSQNSTEVRIMSEHDVIVGAREIHYVVPSIGLADLSDFSGEKKWWAALGPSFRPSFDNFLARIARVPARSRSPRFHPLSIEIIY